MTRARASCRFPCRCTYKPDINVQQKQAPYEGSSATPPQTTSRSAPSHLNHRSSDMPLESVPLSLFFGVSMCEHTCLVQVAKEELAALLEAQQDVRRAMQSVQSSRRLDEEQQEQQQQHLADAEARAKKLRMLVHGPQAPAVSPTPCAVLCCAVLCYTCFLC